MFVDATDEAARKKVSNDFGGNFADRFRKLTLTLTVCAKCCVFAKTSTTVSSGVMNASALS